MLELNFLEWKRELELIVEDTYGISLSEFCKVKTYLLITEWTILRSQHLKS